MDMDPHSSAVRPRRIAFTCDARSLVSLEQLDARGLAVETIPLTHPVTGKVTHVTIPRLPAVHPACPGCHCGEGRRL